METNEKMNTREGYEIRTAPMAVISRSVEGGTQEKMTIGGYAVRFEEPQTYKWGNSSYTEVIHKGALDATDMKRVPLRYNHNDAIMVMARTKNGSLRLMPDEFGLKIEADLIDTQSNRDLYKCIKDGLLDEMSFAFTVRDAGDTWTFGETETKREINDIDTLYDVSVVDNGFYEGTSVMARSFDLFTVEKERHEELNTLELERVKAQLLLTM